jgi:hypothetical protein
MKPLPTMVKRIPIQSRGEVGSDRTNRENMAKKSGIVLTRVAELATDVSPREWIQKAKWSARNNPEVAVSRRVRTVHADRAALKRRQKTGARMREANVTRYVAMERDGASARRIRMEAVEIEAMPMRTNPARSRGPGLSK